MKNQGSLRQRRAVVRAVLRYLITNPDAKDTIEGVRKWWLPAGYREQPQGELEGVLDFLASKNWLTTRMTFDQKIYGVNKKQLAEIRIFLEKFQVRQKN